MVSALILRKPTNLEQHLALQAQSLLPQAIEPSYLAFITQADQEHYSCLDVLKQSLKLLNVDFDEAQRGEPWPKKDFDFIIALGGDGTLITASYGVHGDTPIIGIKSSSASVGYLCAADQSSVDTVMKMLLGGQLEFLPRHRLRAVIARTDGSIEKSPYFALNDFLFAAANPAATTRYRIANQERMEVHKSSGIWISTATGSTAAISAAGGLPMVADDYRFQFRVRELYRAQGDGLMINGGFSNPADKFFWIENHCPAAILALDGEKWEIKIGFGDVLSFEAGPPVRVALRPQDLSF